MTEIRQPVRSLTDQLIAVDQHLRAITHGQPTPRGDIPTEAIAAGAALAQVAATCALVHAVRDLTDQVRALRPGAAP